MNLAIKDVALIMSKLAKQNKGISIMQLNRNIKKILKPPKKAKKSLRKLGIKHEMD